MFVAGLMLVSLDPITSPMLKIIGYALLIAVVVWGYLRCRNSTDEVVRAANEAALSWGTPLGLGLALLSIFAVRYVSGLSELLTETLASGSAVDPSIVGFGTGVLLTCALVVASASVTWVGWWITKR